MNMNRRRFLTSSTALAAGGFFSACCESPTGEKPATGDKGSPFQISLAQWSLHKALKAGELDNLDYAKFTKENFGINALEWVNQFFYVEDA